MLKWLRRSEPKEVPAASLGQLQIIKPWARSSSSDPAIAGGYMTVVNEGETDRLVSAAPLIKGNLLAACVAIVSADGVIIEEEAELLRAIADSLDCPIPPVIGGG